MKPIFVGSGVAIITPFDKDEKIDFDRFQKLIEFQIANKTDAIIVCGTTGEGSTLSTQERLKLFSFAAEKVAGRVPVIGGTGSNSTSFSLNLAKEAEKTGIDAHLMVTPYYNKTSQNGLIRHYFTLADELNKPIIVYNVPGRTGMNITAETYKKLSEHPNIRGVKEADNNITKLTKAIGLCGKNLDFYIGNDDMICASAFLGCKGVISVLSNIVPLYTHNMTIKALRGENREAVAMQNRAMPLIDALFSDVNPIPVKHAMKYLKMDSGILRLPLCEMQEEKAEKLERCIYEFFDYSDMMIDHYL